MSEGLGKPSFTKELVIVAAFFGKATAVLATVVNMIALLFYKNPLIGYCVFSAMLVMAQVGFCAWQSYKWKKQDYEREKKRGYLKTTGADASGGH